MKNNRITIRIGRNSLSFAAQSENGEYVYEPFVLKSGISLAANLRTAFKTSQLLDASSSEARVMVAGPTLMTPVELFNEEEIEQIYFHTYPDLNQNHVFFNVIPDLNAVVLFSMGKDMKLVIDDHFKDLRLVAATTPVWRHLYRRSFVGNRRKLYGYFHDAQLDIFSFQQNRFRFCNVFDITSIHDSLYFLLYVWKQLQLDPRHDEMYIVGNIPDTNRLLEQLNHYLKNVFVINIKAELGNNSITDIKGMPFDLQTLLVKGR